MVSPRVVSLSLGLAVASVVLTAPHALAATPHWANTENYWASNAVTVRWCSGGTGTIQPDVKTTKNVCGILMRDNRELFVSVKETGTVLIDRVNCNGDKWITFTTKTDTSRTAEIVYYEAGCA